MSLSQAPVTQQAEILLLSGRDVAVQLITESDVHAVDTHIEYAFGCHLPNLPMHMLHARSCMMCPPFSKSIPVFLRRPHVQALG